MVEWVRKRLGVDVPMHFSAFHPAYRMRDKGYTPFTTLQLARETARKHGIRYVYTGNVQDVEGASTYCHRCGKLIIERDGYTIGDWKLDDTGHCEHCGTACAGVFEAGHGHWGTRCLPVNL